MVSHSHTTYLLPQQQNFPSSTWSQCRKLVLRVCAHPQKISAAAEFFLLSPEHFAWPPPWLPSPPVSLVSGSPSRRRYRGEARQEKRRATVQCQRVPRIGLIVMMVGPWIRLSWSLMMVRCLFDCLVHPSWCSAGWSGGGGWSGEMVDGGVASCIDELRLIYQQVDPPNS